MVNSFSLPQGEPPPYPSEIQRSSNCQGSTIISTPLIVLTHEASEIERRENLRAKARLFQLSSDCSFQLGRVVVIALLVSSIAMGGWLGGFPGGLGGTFVGVLLGNIAIGAFGSCGMRLRQKAERLRQEANPIVAGGNEGESRSLELFENEMPPPYSSLVDNPPPYVP